MFFRGLEVTLLTGIRRLHSGNDATGPDFRHRSVALLHLRHAIALIPSRIG